MSNRFLWLCIAFLLAIAGLMVFAVIAVGFHQWSSDGEFSAFTIFFVVVCFGFSVLCLLTACRLYRILYPYRA